MFEDEIKMEEESMADMPKDEDRISQENQDI